MKTLLATALTSILLLGPAGAQAPAITEAPKPIQQLASSIQGKAASEMRKAIVEQLGKPARNIGSGVRIEQWDVAGGVLTFHPYSGPTFDDPKAKKRFHLLESSNPAKATLLSGYEMTTVADPANHGTRYWLGNLQFGGNGTYEFVDSKQHAGERGGQGENFFMLYPKGKVAISYAAPIAAETRLETLGDGATVAELVFVSADKTHSATFTIKSHERERRLTFGADKPLPFEMDAGWKDFGMGKR